MRTHSRPKLFMGLGACVVIFESKVNVYNYAGILIPICYVLGSIVGRKSDTIMHRQKLETISQANRTEQTSYKLNLLWCAIIIVIIEMLVRRDLSGAAFAIFLNTSHNLCSYAFIRASTIN